MAHIYDRDPYAILKISPAATTGQVKEAYHRLARQYHPDLNKDPRAGEQMKDINWAYDILSDPEERSLYDYWRSTRVRTEYYHPATGYPNPTPPSSYTTHTSTRDQARNPPPYNPYPGRVYTNIHTAQGSSAVGCSAWGIIVVFVIVITNVLRAIGPSLSSRPSYNYSPEYSATQNALLATWESSMGTFNASFDTPSPPPRLLPTPSPGPATILPKEKAVQVETQSEYAPGSFVWEQIDDYFPELTTADGLSDEVTSITYDQLRGYHILTHSLGEYWLYIDRYNHTIIPIHFSATAAPMATP